jgi:hypothetical protein
MAARAGIAWISTNLLDVQRVRQVHNHLSFTAKCRKIGQATGERARLGAVLAAPRLLNLPQICSNLLFGLPK